MVYAYYDILFSNRKEQIIHTDNLNESQGYYTEWKKTVNQKVTYYMTPFIKNIFKWQSFRIEKQIAGLQQAKMEGSMWNCLSRLLWWIHKTYTDNKMYGSKHVHIQTWVQGKLGRPEEYWWILSMSKSHLWCCIMTLKRLPLGKIRWGIYGIFLNNFI